MLGNKKDEKNYAEEVEILLGEEAKYEPLLEGQTSDFCPLLSQYGSYAVCNHVVRASYAGCSYDYIYEINIYPSSAEKINPVFHGSILKLHDIETSQKIYCCNTKSASFSKLKGSDWKEQESIGKLRIWTEGGRLYREDSGVIEMYHEWIKERLCIDYAKEYVIYFAGNNMTIIFLKPKKRSVEWRVDTVNSFLLALEEKKILTLDEKKVSISNNDLYFEELAKRIFGETIQYRKNIEGATGTLFPVLSPFGEIMDCRLMISAIWAGYEFEYMYGIGIFASALGKEIGHCKFTGDGLIIHGIESFEKICLTIGNTWENLKPLGFNKKQKLGPEYIWTEEREILESEIDLVQKYYCWCDDTSYGYSKTCIYMMYFDGKDLILIFKDPESQFFSVSWKELRQAFQKLRIQERKERE